MSDFFQDDSLGADAYWAAGLHLYTPLPFRPGRGGLGDRFKTHFFLNSGNLVSLDASTIFVLYDRKLRVNITLARVPHENGDKWASLYQKLYLRLSLCLHTAILSFVQCCLICLGGNVKMMVLFWATDY